MADSNSESRFIRERLDDLKDDLNAVRMDTRDTRDRLIALEAISRRVEVHDVEVSALKTDVLTVKGEMNGSTRRATLWATAISALAGAIQMVWGK